MTDVIVITIVIVCGLILCVYKYVYNTTFKDAKVNV